MGYQVKINTAPKSEILDPQDEAYLMDFTQFIKEGVKVPIIAVGGIRSYSTAEGIVKHGKADYVSLARPFIREPQSNQSVEERQHCKGQVHLL